MKGAFYLIKGDFFDFFDFFGDFFEKKKKKNVHFVDPINSKTVYNPLWPPGSAIDTWELHVYRFHKDTCALLKMFQENIMP